MDELKRLDSRRSGPYLSNTAAGSTGNGADIRSGSDAHPVGLELVESHAMTVVRDVDSIVGDGRVAAGRVGVVGVLNQLGDRDVVPADEALAELA